MAKKLYQSAAKVRTAVAELIYILPFNCTDVAPKCDEDIVTEAAEPNPLPVVTSRHPPLLRNPSWLYKRHGLRKLLLLQSHGMVAASTIGWTVDSSISAS